MHGGGTQKFTESALVAGAGGFVGGHLVGKLLEEGYQRVRAVDCKPLDQWFQVHREAENIILDLQLAEACTQAVTHIKHVFNLAADMGGMGFVENNRAACMLSVLINTHLLMASRDADVERYFFASSACVYNNSRQAKYEANGLCETKDVYPADPLDGYGWEKLFSERMCRHFFEDYGLESRVARLHNCYGPFGSWEGGREKVPAALCRKVIQAKLSGEYKIDIWGDGNQVRSFIYVDDLLEGIMRIFRGDYAQPLNLGTEEAVTINELLDLIEEIASVKLERNYLLDAPMGVAGRNSDNSLILEKLGWQPTISLQHGMEKTYRWIESQILGCEGSGANH